MVSRWVRGNARERHILIAAGAGAGLAAAFNAPLAGVIFVLEELRRDFAPGALTGAFIASVTSDVVVRLMINQSPVFHVANPPVPPLSCLPLFLILGVAAGLLGVVFNRTLLGSVRLFERASRWPFGLPAALVGVAVALVGWFAPEALGGGGPLVQATLSGRIGLRPGAAHRHRADPGDDLQLPPHAAPAGRLLHRLRPGRHASRPADLRGPAGARPAARPAAAN